MANPATKPRATSASKRPHAAKVARKAVRDSKAAKRAEATPPLPLAAEPKQAQEAAPGRAKAETASKQSRVIAMLQSAEGATITAMMQATGWQQHSVRGLLAAVIRKKLQLKLASSVVDGDRVYRIADDAAPKASSSRANRRAP